MFSGLLKLKSNESSPIVVVLKKDYTTWQAGQCAAWQQWMAINGFQAKTGQYCLLPGAEGQLQAVVVGLDDVADVCALASLASILPEGDYHLENIAAISTVMQLEIAIAWGGEAYFFDRYKESTRAPCRLFVSEDADIALANLILQGIYLTRDLINTPTEDMGPPQLAKAASNLAHSFHGTLTQIVGDDLLKQKYPAIHTVGRASDKAPRLIDLQWGKNEHPRVTLVGKGVCFDTGGLNLKSGGAMGLMKKDMGGAAHVLGLARMIMAAKLPIYLRVLIPAVENAIAGNAYRPGDVITMRDGTTVEVTNTDAEGRLVLADALVEAASDRPELIIDMATLTGAAKVATGTEISAYFSNDDELAKALEAHATAVFDPVCRLPLHKPYQKMLESKIAHMMNSAEGGFAGAITAALFLQHFLPSTIPWLHVDMMAWNVTARPGHPIGGEAMGLRALFALLQEKYR